MHPPNQSLSIGSQVNGYSILLLHHSRNDVANVTIVANHLCVGLLACFNLAAMLTHTSLETYHTLDAILSHAFMCKVLPHREAIHTRG